MKKSIPCKSSVGTASRHGMNLMNFSSWVRSCYRVDKSSSCGRRRRKHMERAVCQSMRWGTREYKCWC